MATRNPEPQDNRDARETLNKKDPARRGPEERKASNVPEGEDYDEDMLDNEENKEQDAEREERSSRNQKRPM